MEIRKKSAHNQNIQNTYRIKTQQQEHKNRNTYDPRDKRLVNFHINQDSFIVKKSAVKNENKNTNQLTKYINICKYNEQKKYRNKPVIKQKSIGNHIKQKKCQIIKNKHLAKQIPLQLYIQIKQIFKHIDVLKGYGFSEKKITRWMNIFLERRSQMLLDIFLKSYINKKSLQDCIIYERWGVVENVIEKMQVCASKLNESETTFLINQIRSFKGYIQDIVIKKTQSNLDQIFNIGQINPLLKFKRQQFENSPQIAIFLKELKSIQDRYGELTSVSKFNRTMFKQVYLAQQKFSRQFYDSNSIYNNKV